MRRLAILFAVLLAGLYWFSPWLGRAGGMAAMDHPWLRTLGPGSWWTVLLCMIALATAVGLILLVRLGLFIWREMGD